MSFPVSGQRRVTRRNRVTRTRNFSRKTGREGKRGPTGKTRKEETGRPRIVVLFFCIDIDMTHCIDQIDLIVLLRIRMSQTYIGT